jgi:hypothetical protein
MTRSGQHTPMLFLVYAKGEVVAIDFAIAIENDRDKDRMIAMMQKIIRDGFPEADMSVSADAAIIIHDAWVSRQVKPEDYDKYIERFGGRVSEDRDRGECLSLLAYGRGWDRMIGWMQKYTRTEINGEPCFSWEEIEQPDVLADGRFVEGLRGAFDEC